MAETDLHRDLMLNLIEALKLRYRADPMTYVSGNLMLFYEEGDKRKHISPDVFVVHGVPKKVRLNYMTWEEGKGPDLAIELTSKSTRSEDVKKKMGLYRDVLKVAEYFLFDPYQDYLKPSMQGYRLVEGRYEPIQGVDGRLASVVLGLHLERDGEDLRLWDPATARRVPTPAEKAQADRQRAEQAEAQAQADRQRAEQAEAQAQADRQLAEQAEAQAQADRQLAEQAEAEAQADRQRAEQAEAQAEAEVAQRLQAEAEVDRLRRELESLRRREPGQG